MNRVVSRNLKALTSFLRLALIAVLMLSLLPALPVAAANAAVPASVEHRTELDAPAAAPLPAFGAAGAQISRAAARGASVLSLPVAAPARAPDAPVITATKTDALFNDLPPAGPTAGDTIRYTITVVNSGSTDALNTALADTIDSLTTLVGGSLRTTPIARNDGVYQVLGNVGITVPAAGGVLVNDNDPDGQTVSVVPAAGGTVNGGAFAIASDGSFSYSPPAGYEGPDSFSYTAQDLDGNQDSATVTLNVSSMIWFINNTAGAGDGRLSSPFNSLAAFNAAQGATQPNAKPGDSIFIYSGSGAYASGIVLQNSQLLVGQGATATIQAITGITPPAFSNALPATGGSKPTIQNSGGDGIALAANNLVRGLTAGNASGSGLAGSNVGTLTVSEVIVNNATGGGIEVATGTLAVTLQSLTTTSSSDEGIDLTAVAGSFTVSAGSVSNTNSRAINIDGNPSLALNVTLTSVSSSNTTKGVQLRDTTGNFTVTGTGVTDGTGGTIQTITQRGFEAISAQNIALSNMNFTNATTANGVAPGTATCNIAEPSGFTNTGCNAPIYLETVTGVSLTNLTINGSAQNGINGNLVTNFSLVNSDLSNIGNENLENGVQFLNLLGTNTFNNVSIVGSFTRNALIENVQGSSTINLLNSTINTALGQDGFFVKGASRDGNNATITFNVIDSSFTQNQASQLKAHAEENSQVTVDITGNSFTGNAAVVGNSGIDLAARDSATLNFDVIGTGGNPQTFNNGRSHAVNVFISGGGTGIGTVSGNTINGSVVGAGVRAIAEVSDSGNPALTINISNNDINAVAGTGLAAIDVRSRQGVVAATGVANVQATISNNGVDVTNTADANIQFYINSGNTLCGNVTNNTATGVPFFTDSFYVGNPVSGDSNGPGIAQLQGWTGNIDTTWNNNGNTPVNSAFNEGTAPVAATCATVPPAPAHEPEGGTSSAEGNQLSVISDQLSHGAGVEQQTDFRLAAAFNLSIDQPAAPVSKPIYQAPSDSRAPESGETVNVALGTLNPGQQVVITFDVIIDTPTTPQQIVSQVCNQGTVSGVDFSPVDTDDPDVGGASDPTCTTMQPGNITIVKDEIPNGSTIFGFTSTIPGNASFNVTGDTSLPINNVAPGIYTVIEDAPTSPFNLIALFCNDGGSHVASTYDVATRIAGINLEAGETIVCTFSNSSSPTGVTLASFEATAQADHVLVTWETVSELNNAGFNLYRTETADPPSAADLLTFVPSQGPGSAQGFSYSYEDYSVAPGQTYWYWLEDVDFNGATTMHAPVSVVFGSPTAVLVSGLEASSSTAPSALPMLLAALLAVGSAFAWRRRRRRLAP